MTAAVDDPSRALRSFATQFAAAPRPGPVDIEVTVERAGRSMTTTSARLLQEGRVLQVAHAVSSTTLARPRLRRVRPPPRRRPGRHAAVRVPRRPRPLPERRRAARPRRRPVRRRRRSVGGRMAPTARRRTDRRRLARRDVRHAPTRGLQPNQRPGQGGDDRVRRAPRHRRTRPSGRRPRLPLLPLTAVERRLRRRGRDDVGCPTAESSPSLARPASRAASAWPSVPEHSAVNESSATDR